MTLTKEIRCPLCDRLMVLVFETYPDINPPLVRYYKCPGDPYCKGIIPIDLDGNPIYETKKT